MANTTSSTLACDVPSRDGTAGAAATHALSRRALLQQAGVSNLTCEIIVTAASPLNTLSGLQIYQADLASIGVKLNITQYDPATWADHVLGHSYNALYATGDVIANLLPIDNLNGPTWQPVPNNTNWDTPEWKTMWAQVASEADPAKQKTLYASMNDYILDQSWAMPITTAPQILVGTSKLKGVTVNQYSAWYFTDAWLDV